MTDFVRAGIKESVTEMDALASDQDSLPLNPYLAVLKEKITKTTEVLEEL